MSRLPVGLQIGAVLRFDAMGLLPEGGLEGAQALAFEQGHGNTGPLEVRLPGPPGLTRACGMPVVIDPALEPGTAELREAGVTVVRIVNLEPVEPPWKKQPFEWLNPDEQAITAEAAIREGSEE